MIHHMINRCFSFWFVLLCLVSASAYGKNVPNSEYHNYQVGHGIELQFTDSEQFVNILRDGKLVWRQFLAIDAARLRAHEERRLYFEDVDGNGVRDFYYVFENYVGTADQMRPDTFWNKPVEQQRHDKDFDPFRDTKSDDFAFFLCLDMGSNCALIRYQADGKCIDESGYNSRLCEKYRGKGPREKATVGISAARNANEWSKVLDDFARKYLAPEVAKDIRYAHSKGNFSPIRTPERFKPLEPWVERIKVKSKRAILYRDKYSNVKLGGYLVSGDEAEVLDRYLGSVMAKWTEFVTSPGADPIALNSNRLLVRYKSERSTTIGWIDVGDTESIK